LLIAASHTTAMESAGMRSAFRKRSAAATHFSCPTC
jgi:hypothetical protein